MVIMHFKNATLFLRFWLDEERESQMPEWTMKPALLRWVLDGFTSVARRGDANVVLTTGGMLKSHSNPARIFKTPVE